MSEGAHKSHKKEYILVFIALAVMTVAELLAAEWKNYTLKASSLTLLAFGKAFTVAYFYMHLKEETRWTRIIAAVPLAAFLYAFVLILEAAYR